MSEHPHMLVLRDITGKEHPIGFGDGGLDTVVLLARIFYPGSEVVRFVVSGEDQSLPEDMPRPHPLRQGRPVPATPDRAIWYEDNDWDEQP